MKRKQSKIAATGEFVADMGKLFASDVASTYNEASQQSRRGKIATALWGTLLTAYTVGDDVPMGFLYSAIEHTSGTPTAVGAVGGLSTGIAGALAMVQRRRKINRIVSRGNDVIEENGSLLKDSISTYGIGAPATVLAYESGTIPTAKRTLYLAGLYGLFGQGLSYAGFETAGDAVGIHPKAALATGIILAGAGRYGVAVRDIRREEAANGLNVAQEVTA